MKKNLIDLSIIIPVYNSSNNLLKLIREVYIDSNLKKMKKEIILVNDFSNFNTKILLNKIKKKYKKIKLINLKKNSGQHYSTLVGIDRSKGKYIVTLDDDLEHSPKSIYRMLLYLKKYNYDVVFERNNINKNLWRNLTSKFNQWVIKKVFGLKKDLITSSFRIIKRKFAKKILNEYFNNPNISCMILNQTHNIGNLKVDYKTSKTASRYTIKKLLNLNKVIIFDYSNWLIKITTIISLVTCFIGAIYGIISLFDNLNNQKSLPGWTSTIVLMSFFSSIIIFSQYLIITYLFRVLDKKKFEKNNL